MVEICYGKILRVDLNKCKVYEEKWDLSLAKILPSGVGLSAKIMLEEVGPNVKPFDPENRLVFMAGVLTGFTIPR